MFFSVSLFVFLNIRSYIPAIQKYNENYYECLDQIIELHPECRLSAWGFPFIWGDKDFNGIDDVGGILNILILISSCFLFGLIFRFIWSKIAER